MGIKGRFLGVHNGRSSLPLFTIRPLLLHLHRRLGSIGVVFGLVIRVIEAALQRKQAAAAKVKRASEIHVVLQFHGLEVVTHVGGNGCDFLGPERSALTEGSAHRFLIPAGNIQQNFHHARAV
ncbi:hypothetical protein [Pseudomonas sp. QTF5]|uniref:hypothetical protein n=1 Tax=Pseudomonas sp. QTF5 TaxID=1435425 RepID=UPI00130476BF|nr:hypothetical protein [Pseudomonas sp. QTF5]